MTKGNYELIPDWEKLYQGLMDETCRLIELDSEIFGYVPAWKKQLLLFLKRKSLEKKCPKSNKQLRKEIRAKLNEAYGDEDEDQQKNSDT